MRFLLQVLAMVLFYLFWFVSTFFYFMNDLCQAIDGQLAYFLRFALFGGDDNDDGSDGGVCG